MSTKTKKNKTPADLIKAVRKKHGLTQTQLAEKLALTKTSISRIENNHHGINPQVRILLEMMLDEEA